LGSAPRRAGDEEDVVVSAMKSFYLGASAGRFPDLHDRLGLWPLLVKITTRKAFNQIRGERAEKRGGGQVRGESVLVGAIDEAAGGFAEIAVSDEPSPQFAAEMAEECRRLLERLPDKVMQSIAELKLQGYSTIEMSKRLNLSPRTVERRLQSIREIWSTSMDQAC
jgi:DNA-directed RNA polymerase specialized sigma24 family protein